jgi:hypothetical protein
MRPIATVPGSTDRSFNLRCGDSMPLPETWRGQTRHSGLLEGVGLGWGGVRLAAGRTETFLRFAQENRDLFRIVFGHGASFHDVVRQSQELFVADVKENLLAGMRSGTFRDANADIWAQAFIGMSIEVVSWWIAQEGVPIEEVTRSVTDLALHGIAADAAGK